MPTRLFAWRHTRPTLKIERIAVLVKLQKIIGVHQHPPGLLVETGSAFCPSPPRPLAAFEHHAVLGDASDMGLKQRRNKVPSILL